MEQTTLTYLSVTLRYFPHRSIIANDERRALAAIRFAKMCHDGFTYSVSNLLIFAGNTKKTSFVLIKHHK
jgi:hypothetical protein